MNQIYVVAKRVFKAYREKSFFSFLKSIFAYIFRGFQPKKYNFGINQGRKVFYIDYFSPDNSNFYWLKAFRKFRKTITFDIIREDMAFLNKKIMNFKPNHVHLGGSVKDNMISSEFLSDLKKKLNCTISVFYGDAIYSSYHCELAKVSNYIYISNKTHIKVNKGKGFNNFKYMPCPTEPDVFKHYKSRKAYDVLFIGNNNQVLRLPLLKKLSRLFNVKVIGSAWENTGINFGNPVYGKGFSKYCSKAKINIGILDPKHTKLEAYFSNRLINTLATGSFYIQRYTPGLEKVFTNRKHLVWYTRENELIDLIKFYLVNGEERNKIAIKGQKEVYKKYTYEKSVKKILIDSEKSELDKDWCENLNKLSKKGDRFSLEWYQSHIITKELLNRDVLEKKIIDLGCGIGVRAYLVAKKNKNIEIIGVDASEYAVQYAINNFKLPNLQFVVTDILKLPFDDLTFDNAYMLAVIEHIKDTGALLKEVKRIIKPKGKLFLSVTEKDYHSDPHHVHVFTKRNLKSIVTANGLKVLDLYVKEHIIFTIIEI
ncbi:MAG: methyltransferase domain-containing protein [Actinomycetia bacterium]|nr:methyltransferase domain-containing protein [Actinomycetes bacterium]